jgi:hypothetical protein
MESARSPHERENHPHSVQGDERRSRTESTGFAPTRTHRRLCHILRNYPGARAMWTLNQAH